MDILRNTIEAFFYSTPIEMYAEAIMNDDSKYLLESVKDTLSFIDPRYTRSEVEILTRVFDDNWMRFDRGGEYAFLNRIPLVLEKFSQNVLVCCGISDPLADFDNLLRWRQISLLIGEDSLVIPRIAKHDSDRGQHRENLYWPNVLNHNNFRLNSILDEELSDTHSHVNAANDVFEFNWLSLMNAYRKGDKKTSRAFMGQGVRMEYDKSLRFSDINNSLEEWSIIAMAIRMKLFRELNGIVTDISRDEIIKAFRDKERLAKLDTDARLEISSSAEEALTADNEVVVDYAMRSEFFNDTNPVRRTPFMIHYGERRFLYEWFLNYYSNSGISRATADLMMLYLVIKNKVRREFVQTNLLSGFLNFQTYQDSKNYFIAGGKLGKAFRDIMFRYAVQSSLTDNKSHFLEARVCPEEIDTLMVCDYNKAIFTDGAFCDTESTGKVSLIAHFIKSADKEAADDILPRHYQLRDRLGNQVETLLESFRNNAAHGVINPLTGIDAASSEHSARPEVFAPFFRYLRFYGMANFTFHAGEDFYDIADGLRTIDETVSFFGYKAGNRIGHGLALGADSSDFYHTRHNTVIIPRQILLDNLVWMKFYAAENDIELSPHTLLMIERYFSDLTDTLGYPAGISITEYRESMNMRGDYMPIQRKSVPEEGKGKKDEPKLPPASDLPDEIRYSQVSKGEKVSQRARNILNHYERSKKCREEGAKTEIVIFPPRYFKEIAMIQEKMLVILEDKGIVIETNPSSNLKIGRFSRYDQHPIFRFHNVATNTPRHSMVVSINTDDKGVFATSLRNEYSLLAIALKKMKTKEGERIWSDLQIEEYLRRIAHYGNISRFK